MLPDSGIEKMSKSSMSFNPLKYVDTGFIELLKECQKIGMKKSRICLSVFGGAQIFEREDHFNIGKRNYIALRKLIWKHGMLIKHEHVGGKVHRTVKIDIDSGEITLDVNKEKIINYHCTSSIK
jgi:chemotaxis protein CheD